MSKQNVRQNVREWVKRLSAVLKRCWKRADFRFGVYMAVILIAGFMMFDGYRAHRWNSPESDGGIVQYTLIQNIQKIVHLDFAEWRDLKIFYPEEDTLRITQPVLTPSIIGIPAYVLTENPFLTADFVFLMQVVISAAGFYLLSSRLFPNFMFNLLAGLFFVFSPVFMWMHLQIRFYAFIPWIIYLLMRFWDERSVRYLYFAVLALVLQMGVGLYMEVMVALIGVVFALMVISLNWKRLRKARWLLRRKYWIHYAVVGASVVFMILLFNLPFIGSPVERSLENASQKSADLVLSYLIPSVERSGFIYQKFMTVADERLLAETSASQLFLGFVPLVTVVVSISCGLLMLVDKRFVYLRQSRTLFFSLLLILVFIGVLSLGPFLRINNVTTGVRLPFYYLYEWIPLIRGFRVPSRFVVMMSLPLALLIDYWFHEIRGRKNFGTWGVVILVAISVVLVADTLSVKRVTYDRESFHANMYIYDVVKDTRGEVMLEMPSGRSCRNLGSFDEEGKCWGPSDGYYMFTHIYHSKHLVNGYSGDYPRETMMFFRRVDQKYRQQGKLEKLFGDMDVDLILIHKDRIDAQTYGVSMKKFMKNVRSISDVVYEDQKYLLMRPVLEYN